MSQDTPSETPRGDRQHPVRSRLDRALGTFGGVIIAGLGFVITPMWLRAVGIPTVVLHLPLIGLLAHGIWGVVLGYVHVGLGGRFG